MQLRRRPAPGLRLLEVGLSWPPETFLVLKLQGLAARGLDVRVASFLRADDEVPPLAGIRPVRLPHWEDGALRARLGLALDVLRLAARRPGRLVRLVRAARRSPPERGLSRQTWRVYLRLARLDADVFHFEWISVGLLCLPLLDAWRRPVVVSLRGSDLRPDEQMRLWASPRRAPELFARASAVHVVSEALAREAGRYGLATEKARLIRPAVDPGFFRPEPRQPSGDAFSILCVGSLRWLKGFEDALLALERLVREGVPARLEIVGEDLPADSGQAGERRRLLWTAADLGLATRVLLPGTLAPAEVLARLRQADVFLQTSYSEGLPNVVLEAMACALPVVATDVGGTGEAVRDGVDGFLVPPRNPAAAAAALARLWHEPALRRRLGEAGRARVEAEFVLARQTARWAALYAEACGCR